MTNRGMASASAIALALALAYAVLLVAFADGPSDALEVTAAQGGFTYADKVFSDDMVHTVDIRMEDQDWEHLKAHALYKECHDATVTVDGEDFRHVGVRTKGNVTLIQSVVRDSDRYSLVVDFGAFDESQRCHGLDRLALNNCICDSSYMRDYLCYDMMRSMGLPAPLAGFAAVYLNGDYLGLYSMVECMAESFCVRNFGAGHGNLYKPEQMDICGMLTGSERDCALSLSVLADQGDGVNAFDFLGVSDATVSLRYQGEDLASYDDIWDNAAFPIGRSDKRRMVEAIRKLSQGTGSSDVLHTDELLRYLAVSAFVLNDDCYLSYAGHNYGLYEQGGRLQVIPWDYDHALGCMGATSGSASWTDVINLPIDEPLIGTMLEERPLVRALLADDALKERYHAYLDEFLSSHVESGRLVETAEQMRELIKQYVLTDPTSGVDETRFEAAYASDLDFCRLRAQSVRGQLAGTIPATAAGQAQHADALVDCSGFVSPDSGSLTELLLPEGSGLGFEDLIGRLEPQVNPVATVAIMPLDSILSVLGGGGSDGDDLVDKLVASGKVHDPDALQSALRRLVVHTALQVLSLLLAPVVLVAALVFASLYGRRRQPAARHGKRVVRHAV